MKRLKELLTSQWIIVAVLLIALEVFIFWPRSTTVPITADTITVVSQDKGANPPVIHLGSQVAIQWEVCSRNLVMVDSEISFTNSSPDDNGVQSVFYRTLKLLRQPGCSNSTLNLPIPAQMTPGTWHVHINDNVAKSAQTLAFNSPDFLVTSSPPPPTGGQ